MGYTNSMPGTCIWLWIGKLFIVAWSQHGCLVFLWDCLHLRKKKKSLFCKKNKELKKNLCRHLWSQFLGGEWRAEVFAGSLEDEGKRDWKCKTNIWTLWEEPSQKPQKVGFWLSSRKKKSVSCLLGAIF